MSALCAKRIAVRPDANGGDACGGDVRISSRERRVVPGARALQVGGRQRDSVSGLQRPVADEKIAPTCPSCQKKAQLVTRDELFPFRPDRKLHDLFYVCCGNMTPATSKTLAPLTRLRGYVSRRLRREALSAFNQLTCAEFGYGHMHASALTRCREWLQDRLEIPHLDVSIADALTCHRVIRACYSRLQDFGRRGGYGISPTNRRRVQ